MNTESNKSPLISIVIPTYNRADYIIETIHSIQNQTYANWELLIMDDGSTDNTELQVTNLNDSRIQFIKLGRIGINGKVKNEGIRRSKGAFIALMDSDDLWPSDKLAKQMSAFEEHPDAGYSLTGGYNFKEPGIPYEIYYREKEGIKYGNLFIPYCRGEVSAFTQSLVFKKDCLEKAGYFDETMRFTDYAFIGSLAYYFKGIILYEYLLFRRFHEKNDNNQDWTKGYEHFYRTINHYHKEKMLPAKIVSEVLAKTYLNMAEQYLKTGNRKMAMQFSYKAWTENPLSIQPLKKMLRTLLFPVS